MRLSARPTRPGRHRRLTKPVIACGVAAPGTTTITSTVCARHTASSTSRVSGTTTAGSGLSAEPGRVACNIVLGFGASFCCSKTITVHLSITILTQSSTASLRAARDESVSFNSYSKVSLLRRAFPFTVKVCGCSIGVYLWYKRCHPCSAPRWTLEFGRAGFSGDPFLPGAADANFQASQSLRGLPEGRPVHIAERNHLRTWTASGGRKWGRPRGWYFASPGRPHSWSARGASAGGPKARGSD